MASRRHEQEHEESSLQAAEAELSSARIVLESIKEEGLRFTTSIERTRRETARVTDEIPRLTEQEKAASAQLEDDAEAAEKEKTLTETENRRAMSDAENIDAEIAAAEQRIRESERHEFTIPRFEYEYLTGRAEVVHAVAEMKAAAAEAWTEARRTSEEIAMRAEAIERELGEASAADAEVTNTPRRPVEARGSGSAATTRMEKSRRMSSSSKPRAPSSNVKRKRRVLTLNCLKLLAGKCRGQN
uniref:Myosin heavy chain-like protein n=1 Tax=Oryza sativa subsp. japonica TaxID=39947 RepID=Q5QLP7_ORYSJ|nr:myosin heavy chain-like protein [Oryza sativa Japonica Group]